LTNITLSPSTSSNGKVDFTLLKEKNMTGKKITSKERPDENARQLASTLTLEEQVRTPLYRIASLCESRFSPTPSCTICSDLLRRPGIEQLEYRYLYLLPPTFGERSRYQRRESRP
jgi:hypothetical protein